MPNIVIIKTSLYIRQKGKDQEVNFERVKANKKDRVMYIVNKPMKVKIVDNKSDATTPITTTQEISTSTNNTKSLSEPSNDSAILKSIKIWFVNLNLVNDEINNILTEDVVVNKILMQLLNLLPIKHRELYLPNGVKFKATSKIKDRLEELESAEKNLKSALIKMSNIKIQAALGLDVLTLNVQH